MKILKISVALLGLSLLANAQSDFNIATSKYTNWHNANVDAEEFMGINLEKAYEELLKGKKPKKKIVVAIMDSGVDLEHPEFEGMAWVNADEIPGNGIDDDNNGYVDDIHGWNFLGNAEGENIEKETLEFARIVAYGEEGTAEYEAALAMMNREQEEAESYLGQLKGILRTFNDSKEIILNEFDINPTSMDDLDGLKSSDKEVIRALSMMSLYLENNLDSAGLAKEIERISDRLEYSFNPKYNPRKLVGDDPFDITDKDYGNSDVKGPDASHGTAVAGVVAAIRDGKKVEGIASSVSIMSVRTTPDGDERDKDVALGIRYAVDNGAKIINMSFGKDFSPQKKWVDDAMRYAESKGVLVVHAAGNSSHDIDKVPNFPNEKDLSGEPFTNWLSVGASGPDRDETLAAFFSNYGRKSVDIFAPGVSIVSLEPDNSYGEHNGTSLAAPVVTGVAALVWSYYPELSLEQLMFVIRESASPVKSPKKVKVPNDGGKQKTAKFKKLSKTGGLLNAYRALEMAEELVSQ